MANFRVMGVKTKRIREEEQRGAGRGADASVSILRDLSASGCVQASSTGLWARVVRFAGVGAVVVGVTLGGVWIWLDGADMAEAQVAREVVIRQAGQKGYERRVEADLPRGERELSMKSSFPVVSPRPGGEAGAVMLGAAGGGSPKPSVGAKSVLVGLTRGREVRPVDRRLTAKVTAVRKESRRASISKIGGSRIAKKQALRRSPEGAGEAMGGECCRQVCCQSRPQNERCASRARCRYHYGDRQVTVVVRIAVAERLGQCNYGRLMVNVGLRWGG